MEGHRQKRKYFFIRTHIETEGGTEQEKDKKGRGRKKGRTLSSRVFSRVNYTRVEGFVQS